jgi:hypothetical protein
MAKRSNKSTPFDRFIGKCFLAAGVAFIGIQVLLHYVGELGVYPPQEFSFVLFVIIWLMIWSAWRWWKAPKKRPNKAAGKKLAAEAKPKTQTAGKHRDTSATGIIHPEASMGYTYDDLRKTQRIARKIEKERGLAEGAALDLDDDISGLFGGQPKTSLWGRLSRWRAANVQ